MHVTDLYHGHPQSDLFSSRFIDGSLPLKSRKYTTCPFSVPNEVVVT